jgi:aminoglycoside phosphotransferase (APT) family kinase protein
MAAGFERMRTQALTLPDWNGPETWIYSDLIPGHQCTYSGLLVAVIECDGTCSGEPSEDLTAVWMVLTAHYRPAFRAALAVDDSTWLRS